VAFGSETTTSSHLVGRARHRAATRSGAALAVLLLVGSVSACGSDQPDAPHGCPVPTPPDAGTTVHVTGRHGAHADATEFGLLSVSDDRCSADLRVGAMDDSGIVTVRVGETFAIGDAQAMLLGITFRKEDMSINGGYTAQVWVSDTGATEDA
jgi:hypothetical protein